MSVELNHTIVPVSDRFAAATDLAEILGVDPPTTFGPFQVLTLANGVSLDFADDHGAPHSQHYAFMVGEEEFDAIRQRIVDRGRLCTVSVDVISTQPGVYVNTIPAGALTANGGITNNDPTTDSLTVAAATFSLGNRVGSNTTTAARSSWQRSRQQMACAWSCTRRMQTAIQRARHSTRRRLPMAVIIASTICLPAITWSSILASQFTGSGPLAGYWSSGTTLSGSGTVTETSACPILIPALADNDDNGTRQASGDVISSAVTLGPTANEPINDTDADPTNPAGGTQCPE